MEEEREKALRQPVIRTNVDGLRIAGQEKHNSYASLFIFFNLCPTSVCPVHFGHLQ